MNEQVDEEVAAIGRVLEALAPLSDKARVSVIEYVAKRLDIRGPALGFAQATDEPPPAEHRIPTSPAVAAPMHLKEFMDQKQPKSASEMAALVAYYLGNMVAESERKQNIDHSDIDTYFKIAGYPLPKRLAMTLPNAKAAGYFDTAGGGAYKLNAVGHNLIVHAMPRGAGDSAGRPRKRRARTKSAPAARRAAKPRTTATKKPSRG